VFFIVRFGDHGDEAAVRHIVGQDVETITAGGFLRRGSGLASQEEKIREWCQLKGYTLLTLFSDEGESAYNDDISKRPKFAALLSRLPNIRPDVVVVFSLDRWARSTVVASRRSVCSPTFRSALLQSRSPCGTSDPASRLILSLLANFAEYSSASTGQHVKRVADLKFEKGVHRGSIPFGYRSDPGSSRLDPRPPVPDDQDFSALVELFQRALTGTETCQMLADWLNRQGFATRNRKPTALEAEQSLAAKPRRFTADSVRGILTNPFYAGFVVRQRRTRRGTPSGKPEVKPGVHRGAVSEEEFDRVQSILRSHYKAPRSKSPKFRPYLAKDLLRCYSCGEKAWCHHIKGINYYQESSASRGISCEAAGRYWPAPAIDRQIENLVKPVALPEEWKRACPGIGKR
jgi:site-specific DNA recombinase